MTGFHPPRITQPQRIISSARALSKLPREVVHQILDNMTVFQVLQLASCLEDPTYLDECILGHSQYQHLFASQQDLTEIRDLFIVFYDIRSSLNMEHAPVSFSCKEASVRVVNPSMLTHARRNSHPWRTTSDSSLLVVSELHATICLLSSAEICKES